jgi:hypothetical protein
MLGRAVGVRGGAARRRPTFGIVEA